MFCCCVITYKPLFTLVRIFSHLSSWIAAYGSRPELDKSHKPDMNHPEIDGSHVWIDLEGVSGAQRGLLHIDIDKSKLGSHSADGDFVCGPDFGQQVKTVRAQRVVEHF
jgi:hypothetical protein